MFPDDASAEQWLIKDPLAPGHRLPRVRIDEHQCTGERHKTMPFRCRDCRKKFSVKTGTPMHSAKVGYRYWLFAIYLISTNLKSISSMKLHRELGITQKSAWHLAHRIRKGLGQQLQEQFAGPVEAE